MLNGPASCSLTIEAAQELYRRIEQLEGALHTRDNVHHAAQLIRNEDRYTESRSLEPSSYPDKSVTNAAPDFTEVSQQGPVAHLKEKTPLTRSSPKWYFRGSRVLSRAGEKWLSTRIGQDISIDAFLLLDPIASSGATLILLDDLPMMHIPEPSVSYQAVETLTHDGFRSNFPMLARRVCHEMIRTAQRSCEGPGSSTTPIASEAYIWALHGIFSFFSLHTPKRRAESEVYITKARGLLARIPETMDVETLECVILLVGI